MTRYRVGRKLGRTVYRQCGDEASDQDQFLGIFDSAAMARKVVALLNLEAAIGHNHVGQQCRSVDEAVSIRRHLDGVWRATK